MAKVIKVKVNDWRALADFSIIPVSRAIEEQLNHGRCEDRDASRIEDKIERQAAMIGKLVEILSEKGILGEEELKKLLYWNTELVWAEET